MCFNVRVKNLFPDTNQAITRETLYHNSVPIMQIAQNHAGALARTHTHIVPARRPSQIPSNLSGGSQPASKADLPLSPYSHPPQSGCASRAMNVKPREMRLESGRGGFSSYSTSLESNFFHPLFHKRSGSADGRRPFAKVQP